MLHGKRFSTSCLSIQQRGRSASFAMTMPSPALPTYNSLKAILGTLLHGLIFKEVQWITPKRSRAGGDWICMLPDESRPRGGFIIAETLVQNGTAGVNGTAGNLTPASAKVSGMMKPPLGPRHFIYADNVCRP